ncbi:unnamed protein product [Trifolium pratense]|uniref:Uncharacterized protein n=1 Tax=Trifolium pratense TaxID=57577 RepID=A0ACB0K917_TRIPR|nr:unnamed protein product [Trifolium pratense]
MHGREPKNSLSITITNSSVIFYMQNCPYKTIISSSAQGVCFKFFLPHSH